MAEWEIPKLDPQKCVACGICVDVCPQHVLEMRMDGLAFARPQDCTYCGRCEESCPQDAVICAYEIGWAS